MKSYSTIKDVEFRAISEADVKSLNNQFKNYTNNKRFNSEQFSKYFDEKCKCQKIWYGCFKNNKLMALSLLKKIPENFVLLAEFQTIVKGYGKLLLDDILSKSNNIWWCADPTGGESLVDYYRQFGLEEQLIKMSKWTNTPEYAFFKVSDAKHRQQILDVLAKADMKSKKYNPKCL